ncbi:MAG: hypothetical protein JW832_18020 [Deltaproteobacteria bacterium]|nr:hypothetical protein [Deltaproteobacteria bacterium]
MTFKQGSITTLMYNAGAKYRSVDWEKGRYRDYSILKNGREVYDWQTGNYLDVQPRGEGRFEVYDWQEHNYYDVKVKHR